VVLTRAGTVMATWRSPLVGQKDSPALARPLGTMPYAAKGLSGWRRSRSFPLLLSSATARSRAASASALSACASLLAIVTVERRHGVGERRG